MNIPEQYDAHVRQAEKVFRDCGFTLQAIRFKRSPEALVALKRFNGLADDAPVPFAWGYHPNQSCKARWEATGRLA